MSDIEVGKEVLKRIVLVHLPNNADKFRMLLFMIRKLYSLVAGDCAPDNRCNPTSRSFVGRFPLWYDYQREN